VVCIEQASEASLQALLEELNQRGFEIVAVVPKIGSAMAGLTRTEGALDLLEGNGRPGRRRLKARRPQWKCDATRAV